MCIDGILKRPPPVADAVTLLDALGEPSHTGDHRCWPCTAVNAAAILVSAVLLGRRQRALGIAVAIIGGLLVWLRGYVIPYTPRFAPVLVDRSPVPARWFDHRDPPATGTDGLGDDIDGERLIERLLDAGVLIADDDRVDLNPSFADRWDAEMTTLASRPTEALADATFEVAHAGEVSVFEGQRNEWIILNDGSGGVESQTWLSRPVAIAETAAVRALGDELDARTRRAAAGPLRVFLRDCPDCGTALREATTQTCCGGGTDPRSEPDDVLACPACDVLLHTFDD